MAVLLFHLFAALRAADIGSGNALLLDPHYDGELLLQACRSTSPVLAALSVALVARRALVGLFNKLLTYCTPRAYSRLSLPESGPSDYIDSACACPGGPPRPDHEQSHTQTRLAAGRGPGACLASSG